MKKLLFILLMMPCWCCVSGQIRPDKPEPAKANDIPRNWTKLNIKKDTMFITNGNGISVINDEWEQYLAIDTTKWQPKFIVDSLQKELFKCQEKSKVDELIIERLFEGIKKEGITVPAKIKL